MKCSGRMTDSCADSLEQRRQSLTQRFLDNLYGLLDSFWSSDGGCHTECTAMMLGMLIKQMLSFGLEVPSPVGRPAEEKSFLQLQEFSNQLRSPRWHEDGYSYSDNCSFKNKTDPWLKTISKVDICHGVRLEDFKPGAVGPKKKIKKRDRGKYLS